MLDAETVSKDAVWEFVSESEIESLAVSFSVIDFEAETASVFDSVSFAVEVGVVGIVIVAVRGGVGSYVGVRNMSDFEAVSEEFNVSD